MSLHCFRISSDVGRKKRDPKPFMTITSLGSAVTPVFVGINQARNLRIYKCQMSHFKKKNPLSFILERNQSHFSVRVSYFKFEDVVAYPLSGVCPSPFSLELSQFMRLFNVERIKHEVHDFFFPTLLAAFWPLNANTL